MDNQIFNYQNYGINKIIEQMQQVMRPVVDMVNSEAFKSYMQSAIQQYSLYNKMIQEYFISDTFQNVVKPMIQLYSQQIKNIVPEILTPEIYNTIAEYKNIINEINFNNLKINDNGTIEYDGTIFEKNEIEESSTELIKDIKKRESIKIDTLLKKILLSFFIIFGTFFMSRNDIEWISLAIMAGFFGQVGTNVFEFFKEKFLKNYNISDNDKNRYFKEHSAIVKLEQLKVRKKPNSNEKIIGYLYFSQLVKIEDVKPYWAKIEYKDKESKISISGWVSTKGLKKFNTLTSQFEDVEENEIGV